MDSINILNYVMEKTERTFRLVIPGFLLLSIMFFAFPNSFGKMISDTNIVILSGALVVSGSCVYVLHRIVFEIIDTVYYRLKFSKIAEIYIYNEENKAEYGLFKWASLHLPIIISELFLFFTFYNEPESLFEIYAITIRVIFGFFMAVSLLAYYFMHRIQKEIYKKKGIRL